MATTAPSEIFKAHDVRGLYGEQIDGDVAEAVDWHFNVRSPNTEPLLRLCLESLVSQEDMEHTRDEIPGVMRS